MITKKANLLGRSYYCVSVSQTSSCNLTVLLYTCVCNCRVSMSLVLYVRLPLILAAKLVGLFFTIALKKKKSI